jgi:hypothetical protein
MIILLGFPKSGTSSFQKLFAKLGYKSYHQYINKKVIAMLIKNNKEKNLPLLSDFGVNDCITQMDACLNENNAYWPQITDYHQIYNENSDSIFILNKRNPAALLSSFKRWGYPNHSLFSRLHKYNQDIIKGTTDEDFIKLIETHYSNIELFFSSRPEAKYISYDIENDNIEKLRKYIDLKEINIFPKENVNPISQLSESNKL